MQVDDAGEAVLRADGQRERRDLLAVARLQLLRRAWSKFAFSRSMRLTKIDARQLRLVGVAPRHLGADLHAGDGIDDDRAEVGGADAALHLADEVRVARACR